MKNSIKIFTGLCLLASISFTSAQTANPGTNTIVKDGNGNPVPNNDNGTHWQTNTGTNQNNQRETFQDSTPVRVIQHQPNAQQQPSTIQQNPVIQGQPNNTQAVPSQQNPVIQGQPGAIQQSPAQPNTIYQNNPGTYQNSQKGVVQPNTVPNVKPNTQVSSPPKGTEADKRKAVRDSAIINPPSRINKNNSVAPADSVRKTNP